MEMAHQPIGVQFCGRRPFSYRIVLQIFLVVLTVSVCVRTADAQSDYVIKRPSGGAPAPTVLFMSGCSGFVAFNGVNIYDHRADELVAAGYAVVYVDHLTKRGLKTNCGGRDPNHHDMGQDLLAAASWVGSQPWADKERIYAVGWSKGAGGVIAALATAPSGAAPIAKAVMYYADCPEAVHSWPAPASALLLLGAIDDMTPVTRCEDLIMTMKASLLRAVIYPNARHGFDVHSLPEEQKLRTGTIGYNEAAAKASWDEVRAFLR
jgi:dienelactone hydrolase